VNHEPKTSSSSDSAICEKVCAQCGLSRALAEFYLRKAKDEGAPRREKRCKSCKAARRGQTTPTPARSTGRPPARCIELKKPAPKPDNPLANVVKISQQSASDFKVWEDAYNRELSQDEKAEIGTNLMALLVCLAEERFRQTGEYVDLRKD